MDNPFINPELHNFIEEFTTHTGKSLESFAENPFVKNIHKVFGFRWLAAIIGEVDKEAVHNSVNELKSQYPHETPQQLVQRIIQQKSLDAAKLGFFTNLIPPFALALFGIEFSGMTRLQAEMVYQIAAVHNFDLQHPSRRGEALAIFGLSLGSGGLRSGLNFFDIVPGLGAVIGMSSNAIVLYSLGLTAHQFYQFKTLNQT